MSDQWSHQGVFSNPCHWLGSNIVVIGRKWSRRRIWWGNHLFSKLLMFIFILFHFNIGKRIEWYFHMSPSIHSQIQIGMFCFCLKPFNNIKATSWSFKNNSHRYLFGRFWQKTRLQAHAALWFWTLTQMTRATVSRWSGPDNPSPRIGLFVGPLVTKFQPHHRYRHHTSNTKKSKNQES